MEHSTLSKTTTTDSSFEIDTEHTLAIDTPPKIMFTDKKDFDSGFCFDMFAHVTHFLGFKVCNFTKLSMFIICYVGSFAWSVQWTVNVFLSF